jgi:hypothetical protein
MSGKYLLDTNAVISLLKGEQSLIARLESADLVAISVITEIEFLSFSELSPEDRDLFTSFCERISIIGLESGDRALVETIVDLRRTYRIKTPDAIICATAIRIEAELITADDRLVSVWQNATM